MIINITERNISVNLDVKKGQREGTWEITPTLSILPVYKPVKPRNIILVLDASANMKKPIGDLTRMQLASQAMGGLLGQLNPADTFSVVTFNGMAKVHIHKNKATTENIAAALFKVNQVAPEEGTALISPFNKIDTDKLITSIDETTIILLASNAKDKASANELKTHVSKREGFFGNKQIFPRIIPIGIGMNNSDKLNKLAVNANPIYIAAGNESLAQYQKAFRDAIDLTKEIEQEKSEYKVQLQVNITAKNRADKKNKVTSTNEYELDSSVDGGRIIFSKPIIIDSKHPPTACDFRFICEGIHLKSNIRFNPEQISKMKSKGFNQIITYMECKDNRLSSWLKCIGSFVLGLFLLAGAAAFYLFLSPFTFPLTAVITAGGLLLGLGMVGYGLVDFLRKTVFPVSKTTELVSRKTSNADSAENTQNKESKESGLEDNRQSNASNPLPSRSGHFSRVNQPPQNDSQNTHHASQSTSFKQTVS
ncbi:MAG TPA: VWA domain-containing protein [Gammaproteobacteria bacterium]|nr:VWA domain-containing protein [Gammaproteobacteria bacterium]